MAEVCDFVDVGSVAYTYTLDHVGGLSASATSVTTTVLQHIGMAVAVAASAATFVIDQVATPVVETVTVTTQVVEDALLIDLVESRAVARADLADLMYDLAVSSVTVQTAIRQSVGQIIEVAATVATAYEIDYSPEDEVVSAALAASATTQEFFTLVQSGAFASGFAIGQQFAVDLVADEAEAAAAISAPLAAVESIESMAVAASATADFLSAVQLVVSEAFAESAAQDTIGGEAWTAPADTWGMSRYEGVDFDSIASIGGRLLATSESGLYAMGQTASGLVQSTIDLGVSELSKSKLVRLYDAYLTYATTGRMTLLAADHGDGDETLYPYEFARNRWPSITPDNTPLGKGHRARFFRFLIKNVAGSDFTVSELRILFDETSRRY